MEINTKTKLKVVTNLNRLRTRERRKIYNVLGLQLWLITRENTRKENSLIEKLLFGGKV